MKANLMPFVRLLKAPAGPPVPPKSPQGGSRQRRLGVSLGALGGSWGALGAILGPSCASEGHLEARVSVLNSKSPKCLKTPPLPQKMLISATKMRPRWSQVGPSWAQVGMKLPSWRQLGRTWKIRCHLKGKLEIRCK